MYRIFFICCLLILFSTAIFSQSKYSLQQCVETAIANNITVKQSGLDVQSAEVQWKQARANLLPNLNGNVGYNFSQGKNINPFTNSYVNQQINYANYGLSSSTILFNGMTLQNIIKQNAYAYEASKMDLQQQKDFITLNVLLAYLQVLNNQDLLEQSNKQIAVTQNKVHLLTISNSQGAISPSALSDLVGQLKDDQIALVNNQNALASSKLTLTQLMNIPFDKDLQVERINAADLVLKYTGSADEIFKKAADELSIMKAAELRRKSAVAGWKAVKGTLYPSLSLNGNIGTNFSSVATTEVLLNSSYVPTTNYVLINGTQVPVYAQQSSTSSQKIPYTDQLNNNLASNINLGLNIPIFNSFKTKNKIRLAKIDIQRSELAKENVQLQLRQQIEQAFLNMQNAWERYKLLLEQVNAYTASFHAAEVRFGAGVGSSVDYLIAKNNLDRANINLINAQYDFVLRNKILDYYNGTLSF